MNYDDPGGREFSADERFALRWLIRWVALFAFLIGAFVGAALQVVVHAALR